MPTTIEPTQELLQTIGHEFGDDHRDNIIYHIRPVIPTIGGIFRPKYLSE
jgi:hypothetical protein